MHIEAKDLSKIYGSGESRVVALDRVSLAIGPGDFISIMGPSGSGKSTLLHLLSGLDRPTAGSLTYDGKNIYDLDDKALSAFRRRRIGFIFQQFNLLPVLTAKENIIMPLLLDKKQPDEAYLVQLAELLGIRERLTHLPHELSGGQQQRVAIARALIAKPDIIFADEPTGNLDSKSGGEVMGLLRNIWMKTGRTLVVITHDSRIAKMAERQFVIVDGVLSEVAAGDSVLSEVAARDGVFSEVAAGDGVLSEVAVRDDVLSEVAAGDGILSEAAAAMTAARTGVAAAGMEAMARTKPAARTEVTAG